MKERSKADPWRDGEESWRDRTIQVSCSLLIPACGKCLSLLTFLVCVGRWVPRNTLEPLNRVTIWPKLAQINGFGN